MTLYLHVLAYLGGALVIAVPWGLALCWSAERGSGPALMGMLVGGLLVAPLAVMGMLALLGTWGLVTS